MYIALYHETGDNWLCNTTLQYVGNSMIRADCFCLSVPHGVARVYVSRILSHCLCYICDCLSHTHTTERNSTRQNLPTNMHASLTALYDLFLAQIERIPLNEEHL